MRIFLLMTTLILTSGHAYADTISYRPKLTIKVGESVVIKGVRTTCDGKRAPSYFFIKGKFPKLKIGIFADGGAGTVNSKSCQKEVPARAVIFKATKPGRAKFELYEDRFDITGR